MSKKTHFYMNGFALDLVLKRRLRATRKWTIFDESNHSDQSQQTQTIKLTNQNSKKIHVAAPKRGKTRAR